MDLLSQRFHQGCTPVEDLAERIAAAQAHAQETRV